MAHETVGRVLTADLNTQLLPITWHGVCSAETYCSFTEEKKEDILPYNIHQTGIKSDCQPHIPG